MPGTFAFTIGHSTHGIKAFIALLQRYDITEVADIRSAPYSQFNPQFNRETLAYSLATYKIEYAFFGKELGGRPNDASCYENGRIRYDRVSKTRSFQKGIERVMENIAGHCVTLMCAEKEPLQCHRTLLVAQALQVRGIAVKHILADGGLETHDTAMNRLLALHGYLQQENLFEERNERIERAIARQTEQMHKPLRVTLA